MLFGFSETGELCKALRVWGVLQSKENISSEHLLLWLVSFMVFYHILYLKCCKELQQKSCNIRRTHQTFSSSFLLMNWFSVAMRPISIGPQPEINEWKALVSVRHAFIVKHKISQHLSATTESSLPPGESQMNSQTYCFRNTENERRRG